MKSNEAASSQFQGTAKILVVLTSVLFFAALPALGQETTRFENLKVLDPDISPEQLGDAMLKNLRGLGLPRRQREGCLYCHVGRMDVPVAEWNFASDEKDTKIKARMMMRMVKEINEHHLQELDDRIDSSFEVDCHTCHKGRSDPRPLPVVLRSVYGEEGIDGVVKKYRVLRTLYEDAGAYDFRPAVLTSLAHEFAAVGSWADAITLATTNEAANPDAISTSQARFTIQVAEVVYVDGVSEALRFYDDKRSGEANDVVDFTILDDIGWGLYRRDRVADAMLVFAKNRNLYADEYIANESMGDALWFSGNESAGFAIFEEWVGENPDHEMGRRRLLNMRDELAQ